MDGRQGVVIFGAVHQQAEVKIDNFVVQPTET